MLSSLHIAFACLGVAKQILNGTSPPYSLDSRTLQQIFAEGPAAHLPVAIYSVAGKYRTGKSFLLNLLHTYLQNTTKVIGSRQLMQF